ncbi:hypothetical protein HDU96_007456 [Phlyctochytrium bullatum]|nr:hypothetical protein HDU96_007456 [Phlyctochytrium bullatum]
MPPILPTDCRHLVTMVIDDETVELARHDCRRKPENGFCCGLDERIPLWARQARDTYFQAKQREPRWVDRKYHPIWLFSLVTGAFEYTFIGPRRVKKYVAVSHLWKHHVFPEVHTGNIEAMTPDEREQFRSHLRAILDAFENTEDIHHVWLDQACVDQQDKESVRNATLIMSYVYEWAEFTVVCLMGMNPEDELDKWLQSTWTMQELFYSKTIAVHLATNPDSETRSLLARKANQEAQRWQQAQVTKTLGPWWSDKNDTDQDLKTRVLAELTESMHARTGGWPLDKLYAIRHNLTGLGQVPCTYDRDMEDVLSMLSEDLLISPLDALRYNWLYGLRHGPLFPLLRHQWSKIMYFDSGDGFVLHNSMLLSPWSTLLHMKDEVCSEWREGDEFVMFVAPYIDADDPYEKHDFDFASLLFDDEWAASRSCQFQALSDAFADAEKFLGQQLPPEYDYKCLHTMSLALNAVMKRWKQIEESYPRPEYVPSPDINEDFIPQFREYHRRHRLLDILALHIKGHPKIREALDWTTTIAVRVATGASEDIRHRCVLLDAPPITSDGLVRDIRRVRFADEELAAILLRFYSFSHKLGSQANVDVGGKETANVMNPKTYLGCNEGLVLPPELQAYKTCGYIALVLAMEHNAFPELKGGRIEAMTEDDWISFRKRAETICDEVILYYTGHLALSLRSSTPETTSRLDSRATEEFARLKECPNPFDEVQSRKGGWPLDRLYAQRHSILGLENLSVSYDREIEDVLLQLSEDKIVKTDQLLSYFMAFNMPHGPLHPAAGFEVFQTVDWSQGCAVNPEYLYSPWSKLRRLKCSSLSAWENGDAFVLLAGPFLAENETMRKDLNLLSLNFSWRTDKWDFNKGMLAWFSRIWFDNTMECTGREKYHYQALSGTKKQKLASALKAVLTRWQTIKSKYPAPSFISTEDSEEHHRKQVEHVHDIISLHLRTHPALQNIDWEQTVALKYYLGDIVLLHGLPTFEKNLWQITGGTKADVTVASAFNDFSRLCKGLQTQVNLAAENNGVEILPECDLTMSPLEEPKEDETFFEDVSRLF